VDIIGRQKERYYMNKKYLTIIEASEYSGLSRWTLYRLSSRREIPMLKFGSKVLIPKDDFDTWLENFRCKLNRLGGKNEQKYPEKD